MDIEVDKTWREKTDGTERKVVMVEVAHDGRDVVWVNGHGGNGRVWIEKSDFLARFEPVPDMVNNPPHYKDASGIECIEVTQHMRFCEGNCFKYVYRAGSKGNLIEDLKKAAWYAERSWTRSRTGNDRVHWLVQRKGEAIADSRDKQGKPFIAEVMRNIVNNRWWQVYDALLTEIERLESE